eukprot:scaffold53258_cov17-Tisochrysis_lutea.AAC.2
MRSAIPAVNAGAAGIKLLLVLLIHWAFQAICWHCRVVPLGHGTRCVQIKRWPQQVQLIKRKGTTRASFGDGPGAHV